MNKIIPNNYHPLPSHAKKVFHGKRFRVYQWDQENFDGSMAVYESVEKSDSVVIYPVVDDQIVIVEEEQPHWGKKGLTVIAGGIEKDEDVLTAARRELEEETGMVFDKLYLVQSEQPLKDVHWHVYTFIAKGHTDTKAKKLDAGERNEVKFVSFEKLIKMARGREFFHRPIFIEEFLVRDEVDKLFEIFENPEHHSLLK